MRSVSRAACLRTLELGAHALHRTQAEPGDLPEVPLLPRVVAYCFAIAQLVEVRPTLPNMAPMLRENGWLAPYERST